MEPTLMRIVEPYGSRVDVNKPTDRGKDLKFETLSHRLYIQQMET